MSRIKVKFCGITRLKDALCAANAGADYLGFIFARKSPRYVTPEKAAEIISKLPGNIIKVGVFVNESVEETRRIVSQCGLDIIQLHGDETPKMAVELGPERVWKVFSLKNSDQIAEVCSFPCRAVLMDSGNSKQRGGTGKTCDWSLAREVSRQRQLILAGGLSPDNILDAMLNVEPAVVDINSGVEIEPGVKNHEKILKIMLIINTYNNKEQGL